MKKLFISYHSTDEPDAEDVAAHLEKVFHQEELELFMVARPELVQPGDVWSDEIIDSLTDADALLVLVTLDTPNVRWINFELGFAWGRGARILLFCDRGIVPESLPLPYGLLQAVDINGMTHSAKLDTITDVVARALDIRPLAIPMSRTGVSLANKPVTTIKNWNRHPVGYIGATLTGDFLVGTIAQASFSRTDVLGLRRGEALSVRLFLGRSTECKSIKAIASGNEALLFEASITNATVVHATIRLAAVIEEDENVIPVIVVDNAEVIS